jgi:hypothetical protein
MQGHSGVSASVPGWSAAQPTRPSARRRARARTDTVQIRVALFKPDFLQFFPTKVVQGLNTEVVRHSTLYNFPKSCRVFSQPVVHKGYAKITELWALVNSNPGR